MRAVGGLALVLLGHALGTVGAMWATYATQDWQWGFAGMTPGLACGALGLLLMFELPPFGGRR